MSGEWERELEKLRLLLPYWVEHNEEHAADFRKWAGKVRQMGKEEAAQDIQAASEALAKANGALAAAMEKLGVESEKG